MLSTNKSATVFILQKKFRTKQGLASASAVIRLLLFAWVPALLWSGLNWLWPSNEEREGAPVTRPAMAGTKERQKLGLARVARKNVG